MIRTPYRAGSFYPAPAGPCRDEAEAALEAAVVPEDLPETLYGGLVPHAGWSFSGRTAAVTLKALAQRRPLERIVLFGADHWGLSRHAAVFASGAWTTPLGDVPVDEALAHRLLDSIDSLREDEPAHAREHSIEVQLPLLQLLCPETKIVPILVAPHPSAVETGRRVGDLLRERCPEAVVVGSTDLTHYGPSYGLMPAGVGTAGMQWAKDNDRRVLELIESLRADAIVEETGSRASACGGGAIAATMAACAAAGATRGICLEYCGSDEVVRDLYGQRADDRVGYAAVVFA